MLKVWLCVLLIGVFLHQNSIKHFMIHKYFEVLCDYCGGTVNHYPERKPDNETLRKDGIVHTRTKQFCSDACYADWLHDKQERQYINLRQRGRIHNNE